MKPATRLRKLLSQPNVCIQAPGVYDGLCARLAIEQGFQVMYQGGSMTTAARLGKADLAFASLNDFAQNAQMIANIDPRIPLIADADVGFGSPPNIARMVQMYDSCGVAGFHIEDQVTNKRCGHLKGKEVVDMQTWESRIRACVIGRDSIYGGSDILIIARTDSLAVEGYQAALDRVCKILEQFVTDWDITNSVSQLLAARECGADMGFLEAIETEEQIMNAVKVLSPMPVSGKSLCSSPPAKDIDILFSLWLIWFPTAKHPGSHPKSWASGESRSDLKPSVSFVETNINVARYIPRGCRKVSSSYHSTCVQVPYGDRKRRCRSTRLRSQGIF
ncbi:unnamed protein product [Penicillium nalgiovense]|nr:unnamed protein product [Penicillium nalgiovense]